MMNEHFIIISFVILAVSNSIYVTQGARVIELDGRILSMKEDNPWLVEFFAPWCGHCKKLEPIYEDVAKEMQNSRSPIQVGRVDGTRLPDVAAHFGIHGYPTIKYIYGKEEVTHRGDRSKAEIVNFAKRAHGPAIREVKSIGRFKELVDDLDGSVFFMLVTPDDGLEADHEYRKTYEDIASKLRAQCYFLAGPARLLKETFPDIGDEVLQETPAFIVVKDSQGIRYEGEVSLANNESIANWVRSERLHSFPISTEGQLYDMYDLGKKVVMFVVNGSSEISQHEAAMRQRFLQLGKQMALERRSGWSDAFQFTVLEDPSVAASLSLSWHFNVPNILVMELRTQKFWMLPNFAEETPAAAVTEQELTELLNAVLSGQLKSFGGDTFVEKLKRTGFDFVTGLVEFVSMSPILALVILGVPTGVVSLLVYAICCMDTTEENEDEEEEEFVYHEKELTEKKDD